MSPHSCVRLIALRFLPRLGGHAGVGVISLHGAHLSHPTLFDSSFKEFFRLGRAMRVGNGGIAHLFVIYDYQVAESDPEKLICLLRFWLRPRCAVQVSPLFLLVTSTLIHL